MPTQKLTKMRFESNLNHLVLVVLTVCAGLLCVRAPLSAAEKQASAQVPVKNSLVGIVVPAGGQPGEQVSGTVVLDPQRYKDVPGLTVYEAQVPLQQVGGQATLTGLVVETQEAQQPADHRILFEIPQGAVRLAFHFLRSENPSISVPGEIPVEATTGAPANPKTSTAACCTHLGQSVLCPSGLPAGSSSVQFVSGGTQWSTPTGAKVFIPQTTFAPCPQTDKPSNDSFQTPPIVSSGGIVPIHGPFDGDSSDSSVKIAGKDAKIIAQSRDVCFADIPEDIPAGKTNLEIVDGNKTASFPVYALGVSVTADKLTLRSGEKTKAHVTLNGPEQLPASGWANAGVPSDLVDVGTLMQNFRVPKKDDEGKILLKIVSSGSIQMKDAKDNTILKWLDHDDFQKGPYKLDLDLHATAPGGFGVTVVAYPFLAPVEAEPSDVPRTAEQTEEERKQTEEQRQQVISKLRDLADRFRDAADATNDSSQKKQMQDFASDFDDIADELDDIPDTDEIPDTSEPVSGDEDEQGKPGELTNNGFPTTTGLSNKNGSQIVTGKSPAPSAKKDCATVCSDEKRDADRAFNNMKPLRDPMNAAERQWIEAQKKANQAMKLWKALADNYSIVPFVGPSGTDLDNAARAYAEAEGAEDAAYKNFKHWLSKWGDAVVECSRAQESYIDCLSRARCPVPDDLPFCRGR